VNYPAAAETYAYGINDNGTIVGWYSKQLPPYRWKHGLIYNNDQRTSLSCPSSKIETTLQDICNGNLIVATTNQGSVQQNRSAEFNKHFCW
jgi:hypothetical protein